MVEGDSMCYDARIRYWEEEWVSRLLEEAIRLKEKIASELLMETDEEQH